MRRKLLRIWGLKVFYWNNTATARKKNLVMIHGLGGDHRGLASFAALFKEYNLYLPDLPGFGLSEPMDRTHTMLNYAAFLEEFCAELGLKKFILLGHSYGATLVLVYAGTHPAKIQKLCLLNPVTYPESITSGIARAYFGFGSRLPAKLRKFYLKNIISIYATDKILTSSKNKWRREQIFAQDKINYKRASDRAIIESFRSYFSTPLYKYAKKIKAKTLVLTGDIDNLATAESAHKLSEKIKRSLFLVLENTGHLSVIEHALKTASVVKLFLR